MVVVVVIMMMIIIIIIIYTDWVRLSLLLRIMQMVGVICRSRRLDG